MLNSFRIVFVTVGGDDGGGSGTIPRCDYVQTGGENFIVTDWGFNPSNIDDTESGAWGENYAYDPRTLDNMMDAYGLVEGDSGRATVLGGRDEQTLVSATSMSDLENTDNSDLFTRGGDKDLLIPSASFPSSTVIEGSTASSAITADENGLNNVRVNTVDIPVENDWPQYIYIGAVGAGGAGRGCVSSVPLGDFGVVCPQQQGQEPIGNICPDTMFDDPNYKAGGTGAEGSFFLKICGANPGEDVDGNEERKTVTIVTKVGKGGIKSWNPNRVRSTDLSIVEFPDQATGEKDTTVTVYDGEININNPDTTKQVLKLTCPGGEDSVGSVKRETDDECRPDVFCGFCTDSNEDDDDVLDIACCDDQGNLDGKSGSEIVSDNGLVGSFLELNDNYFKNNSNGTWSVAKVSTDQQTSGTAISPALSGFGISSHTDWYSNMRGWDTGVDTTNLYRPGLAGSGKFKHWRPSATAHASTNVDGSGGNGGSVYIGYGANVFSPAANATPGNPDGGDTSAKRLTAGSGFDGKFIKPNASFGFDYVDTEAEALSYSPVGDPDAKGREAAVIFRFTETPDITREGDFYLTAQAYHMEDIEKITFIMDGGTPVDVFQPINHPNDLGTNYEKSASGIGAGYREFMIKVDTSNLTHNTVHEIRAIAYPKHGYPVVLGEEKPLLNSNAPESEWKVNPVKYPWINNVYPDVVVDLSDVEGLDIAPPGIASGDTILNPLTGTEEWYQNLPEVVLCGYLSFTFRYQDPDLRKRVYINPLNTSSNNRTGTKENPYLTLSDALHSIDSLPTNDKKDYFSASFYLMGPETDPSSPIGITGGVHDWFTNSHEFIGQLDDRTGGGRQVITVEADPEYFEEKQDTYFNLNEQLPYGSGRDQVMLLPYNGGGPSRMHQLEADIDPESGVVFNAIPKMSVHYKNLRIPIGLPIFANNYFFEASERGSDYGAMIFLDSIHAEPISKFSKHSNYIGYKGEVKNRTLLYPDENDPCQNDPTCEDPDAEIPRKCDAGTNCLPARDTGALVADDSPDGTGTGLGRQLSDPRLPYYNMYIGSNPPANIPNWGENSNSLLNRKLIEPVSGGSYIMNCACRGLIGRRGQGMVMMKHHFEQLCDGDTSANFSGALINIRADSRATSFTGYRSITTGQNTVHSDMQQIDKSTFNWADNRIMADITLTNNSAQLFHFSGLDALVPPPWDCRFHRCCIGDGEGEDRCRGNGSVTDDCMTKQGCEDRGGYYSEYQDGQTSWLRTHKIRNFALVRFKSDGWAPSNTANMFRTFIHGYIKGMRLRNASLNFLSVRKTEGFTWNGENYHQQHDHLYYADNQEHSRKFGFSKEIYSEGEFDAAALANSRGYYRRSSTTEVRNNNDFAVFGPTAFPAVSPGHDWDSINGVTVEVAPIERNNLRQYIPLHGPDGNSIIDGPEFAVTDVKEDTGGYQQQWKRISNIVNLKNSKVFMNTCIYESNASPTAFNITTGYETIRPLTNNPYAPTQFIDPVDVRFSAGVGVDSEGIGPAIGIVGGLTSDGSGTSVEYSASVGGINRSETYNIKFLPTPLLGTTAEMYDEDPTVRFTDGSTPYDGIRAPAGTVFSDIQREGKFIVQGYPNAGDPVMFISSYDTKLFYNAMANGGFEYTDHLQNATNYTPHKL